MSRFPQNCTSCGHCVSGALATIRTCTKERRLLIAEGTEHRPTWCPMGCNAPRPEDYTSSAYYTSERSVSYA